MIDPKLVQTVYVIPALTALQHYSLAGEQILMGTGAIESNFTTFRQMGGGPALGMFQMEKATYDWLMNDWLMSPHRKLLRQRVLSLATEPSPTVIHLLTNHKFAAGMARIRYLAAPGEIPADAAGQADYWWRHYNGCSPHGLKPKDYLVRWNQYCAKLYGPKTPPAQKFVLPGLTTC